MNINQQISVLENKANALRRVADGIEAELAEIKTKASKPAPPTRRNLKEKRIADIRAFYLKRKIAKQ